MSDIRDFALLRSKAGNLEVLPMQVEDADTAEPMALKGSNGALLVNVLGIESVNINLGEGELLPVEIQNEDPIPVSLPSGNLDVEVKNTDPIPVSLPETDIGVQVNNESSIAVAVDLRTPAGQTVQIAAAASASSSFEISGIEAFGVGVPYGTEGASLGLWVSIDETNWFLLPEVLPFKADVEGTNYACNTAGVGLMELLAPWKYCKLQALDAEGAAQVQAANRDLSVVTR